ncbi:hypothetical protein FOMA001_g20264 [Fusarium oxysporum f. sp. matthiolae]|nr:hypothetical protein FOMA001_g20264 [Fusarium oxysporum f. sp. matthiolae]
MGIAVSRPSDDDWDSDILGVITRATTDDSYFRIRRHVPAGDVETDLGLPGGMPKRRSPVTDEEGQSSKAPEPALAAETRAEKPNQTVPEATESPSPSKKKSNTGAQNFFQNIGAVASLGGGLTFGLIVSDLKDPKGVSRKHIFDLSTVRILLASSWLLFMMALSLSFSVPQIWRKTKRLSKALLWKALYLLDIAAVICLSLVVAAYVEVVGFLGVGLAGLVAILVLIG